jgi:hypothetical protein
MISEDECMYLEKSFVSLRGWGRCAPQPVHEASDQRSQGLTKANISPILYLMTQIDGLGSLPQPQSWTGQLWGLAEAVHALPQFSHARPQLSGPVFNGIDILTGFWYIRNLEERIINSWHKITKPRILFSPIFSTRIFSVEQLKKKKNFSTEKKKKSVFG